MARNIVLLAIVVAVAWYFFRDEVGGLVSQQAKQGIYRWKDDKGIVHYSSNKADAPRGAKQAGLPEIGVMQTDRAALEKQAARLKANEQSERQPAGGVEKPKLPQVRNLAIERIEQAAEKLSK